MITGWDSKTDTFFISGLTDKNVVSILASLTFTLEITKRNSTSPFPDTAVSLTRDEFIRFVKECEDGLFIAKMTQLKFRSLL